MLVLSGGGGGQGGLPQGNPPLLHICAHIPSRRLLHQGPSSLEVDGLPSGDRHRETPSNGRLSGWRLSKIKAPSASKKAACGHTLKRSGPFWHLPGEPAPEDSLRPFQPPHTWQEISTTGGGDLPESALKGNLPPDVHLSPDFWSPWSPWNSGQPLTTDGVRVPGGQAG